jgi:L-ascorbate metabolism protein UlaG (beta-lactamase superfamily)
VAEENETVMPRSPLAIVLCVLSCACAGHPRAADAPAQAITAPARSHGSIRWIGGPTAVIERGGLRVITDPMLGPRGANAFVLPKHPSTGQLNVPISRYTAPAPLELESLDAILISHTHADHVDARAKELLPKDRPLVVAAAGAAAMRAAGFADVRPLDWGQALTLEAHGAQLRVLAVPAHHSHEADVDAEVGKGNGYVLEWHDADGAYRAYWTGDAVLSEDSVSAVTSLGRLDLLLPHLGGVGGDGERGLRTMDAAETVELVRRVSPAWVVPIHHTSFGHYREPIEALKERAAESGSAAQFHFLRLGQSLALPGSVVRGAEARR